MAGRNNNGEWRERLVQGRARTLIEALERVESRGRGMQQQNILLGRAGVTPHIWVINNDSGKTTCRQEVSQEGVGSIIRMNKDWGSIIMEQESKWSGPGY